MPLVRQRSTAVRPQDLRAARPTEAGSTMIGYLIAVAIVGIVVVMSGDQILQMRKLQDRSEAGTSYNEFEPIIRSNVGNMLFHLQKNLVNRASCGNARQEFQNLGALLNAGVDISAPVTLDAAPSYLKTYAGNEAHKPYVAAINRCNNETFKNSKSLTGKQSFYFCGVLSSPSRAKGLSYLGQSEKLFSFAEFRVTFWDFARGVPLACQRMEGVSGRGGIVQYTVYFIRDVPKATNPAQYALGLRRHSGRFYVPKFPEPAKS